MKIKSLEDIYVWNTIELIYKIYKLQEPILIRQIPTLIGITNFCFIRGYMTEGQRKLVYSLFEEYKIYKNHIKK